jgi:hypothetical protein
MLNIVINFKLFLGGQGKDKNRDARLDKSKETVQKEKPNAKSKR